jgi:N-acetylmuramoyl-L-alanine amidase
MREIRNLVCHCSATAKNTPVDAIKKYWRENLGWKAVGYHRIIKSNGEIIQLAPDEAITNGVAGHNSNSLHVCYIGGKTADDRTPAQKASMEKVLKEWLAKYPKARIIGHRDFPGVKKACPQFSAEKEYGYLYTS